MDNLSPLKIIFHDFLKDSFNKTTSSNSNAYNQINDSYNKLSQTDQQLIGSFNWGTIDTTQLWSVLNHNGINVVGNAAPMVIFNVPPSTPLTPELITAVGHLLKQLNEQSVKHNQPKYVWVNKFDTHEIEKLQQQGYKKLVVGQRDLAVVTAFYKNNRTGFEWGKNRDQAEVAYGRDRYLVDNYFYLLAHPEATVSWVSMKQSDEVPEHTVNGNASDYPVCRAYIGEQIKPGFIHMHNKYGWIAEMCHGNEAFVVHSFEVLTIK